jgi:hypothetical protein
MVPPNWGEGMTDRQPMLKKTFAAAAAEWKDELAKWEAGERPSYYGDDHAPDLQFWEYEGPPPEREYYRPWEDSEATWYQVWETVTEGTPVTPAFETKEELIEYLVENGDFSDQQRRRDGYSGINCAPWSREAAEKFVNGDGWAMSLVVNATGIHRGTDILE